MSDLKVGDIVQLKSGGPVMTIHKIGHFNLPPGDEFMEANCVWFSNGDLKHADFDLRAIERYAG